MAQLKKTANDRSMSARIPAKLNCVSPSDWKYPLRSQSEAYTQPTRAETQVFLSGSQHNGMGNANDFGGEN